MQEKTSHASTDFSGRLELALRRAGMTKGGLAESLGVPASTVSRWKGIHHPSPVLMNGVAKTLGVRREWLVAGLEPMADPVNYLGSPPDPSGVINDAPPYHSFPVLPMISKEHAIYVADAQIRLCLSERRDPTADELDFIRLLLSRATT